MSYRNNGLGAPVTRQASSAHAPTAMTSVRQPLPPPQPSLLNRALLQPPPRPQAPPPPSEMVVDESALDLPMDQPVEQTVDPATLLQAPPTEIPWMWIGIGTGAVVLAGGAWWFLRKKKVSANRRRGRRHRRAA